MIIWTQLEERNLAGYKWLIAFKEELKIFSKNDAYAL